MVAVLMAVGTGIKRPTTDMVLAPNFSPEIVSTSSPVSDRDSGESGRSKHHSADHDAIAKY
jgi:hypothetical protein